VPESTEVPIQITFIIVTAILAGLVGLGALLALLLGRHKRHEEDGELLPAATAQEAALRANAGEIDRGTVYERVLRILWWVTIAIVLVGVGVSGSFRPEQPLIFALGGLGVLVVLVLHELLPSRFRSAITFALEALIALALVTGLLLVTGYGNSPFFFVFYLVAVAVALGPSIRVAFLATAAATLAYLGVLALDPNRNGYATADLLRFGLNIGSLWLLAFLAGVIAARFRSAIGESQLDPLTGLLNRAQIFDTLEQEVSRTRRSDRGFCLLMMDLDGLKAANDNFGHDRGDDLLRATGAVIKRSIRTVDSAYRFGGDEFVVLLPETDIPGAFVVAEKIRAGIEEIGYALMHGEVQTSVSIGLVSHPEDGSTADELMRAADAAMYQAKSLGKNQISGVPRRRPAPAPTLPAPTATPAEVAMRPEAAASAASADQTAEPLITGEPMIVVEEDLPPVAAPTITPIPIYDEGRASVASAGGVNGTATQNGAPEAGDEEPDPDEFRRQIQHARRAFDPDHQIRRAMDAFLSSAPNDEGRRPDA
jgi:diguanylate cyclase (GGDEF)-like protein